MSMGDVLNEPAENFGNDVRAGNINFNKISFFFLSIFTCIFFRRKQFFGGCSVMFYPLSQMLF